VSGATDTSTPAHVEAVLADAASAAPQLAATSPTERSHYLRSVAARIDAEADALIDVAAGETHLEHPRLRTELSRTTNQLRFTAAIVADGAYLNAAIDTGRGPSGAASPDVRRCVVPLGPVLNFAASNFPFAFSVGGGDTASAIGAGCPVVVKAHEGHPRLSARVARIIADELASAGAPRGSLGVIYGRTAARTALLDPRIHAAAFTGSTKAGRALFDLACARPTPIPFYGELGGLNPVFVTAGAIAARGGVIAREYIASVVLGRGQFCTKPGMLFLPRDHGLDGILADAAASIQAGLMLNQSIHAAYVGTLVELSQHRSVRVLATGAPQHADGAVRATLLTTSIDQLEQNIEALSVECFGPSSLIVEYDDWRQLPDIASRLGGTLTATIHAEDDELEAVMPMVGRLQDLAGRVVWNGWPTGVAVTRAMQHGGPYPASTAALHTSVGGAAIQRFVRPVAYQDFPDSALPVALQDDNPLSIPRLVNGVLTTEPIYRN